MRGWFAIYDVFKIKWVIYFPKSGMLALAPILLYLFMRLVLIELVSRYRAWLIRADPRASLDRIPSSSISRLILDSNSVNSASDL